jgi:hypothetical protein
MSGQRKPPKEMSDDDFIRALAPTLPKPPVSGGGK